MPGTVPGTASGGHDSGGQTALALMEVTSRKEEG